MLPLQGSGKAVHHPCLPHGASVNYNGHELVGDGDWAKCKRLQRTLFDTSTCPYRSCSFGGAYQPKLPGRVYGFSYLYDRTAAIGLLDGKMQTFGEQQMSIALIERAGAELCALDHAAVDARFATHQDANKAANFCGDVAYVSTLLASFGFSEHFQLTMTNKQNNVELVWTLGAMLAKSAELAHSGGSLHSGFGGGMLLLVALAVVYYASRRGSSTKGYRPTPMGGGHDSD